MKGNKRESLMGCRSVKLSLVNKIAIMLEVLKQKWSHSTISTFFDYMFITFGLAVYAFGWGFFLLPYKMVSGGVTGIAALIFYATGIQISYSYFIMNFVLLVIALKILGVKFLMKTIYAIVTLSLFLEIMQNIVTQSDGTMYQILGPNEDFMAVILGAVFSGIALAIVFLRNGSTGGTDIVAAVVNKYRDISLGRVLIIVDLCIISSSYLIFQDWRKIVFGLVLMFLENFTLDYVMNARRESVQFLIFSRKYKDIAHEIGTKMERGITILDGHGWYSGKDVQVLCILAKRSESISMLRIIKSIDPNAFVSVASVSGVYGEGFDAIKVKAKEKDLERIEMKE